MMGDRWRRLRLGRLQRLLLGLPPKARLLDLGCWTGTSLEGLKQLRPDLQIWGIDRIDYGDRPPAVLDQYLRLDLEKDPLPLQPETFDCVRMAHILEHLQSPTVLMGQVRPLLRRGGAVYLSGPNERSLFVPSFNFGHDQHGPFNFFDDPTHLRPLTTHAIYCWLEAAGFAHAEIEVGIERTAYQFFRAWPTALRAAMLRDRSRLVTALWTVVGWASYGIGRRIT